jgi:hypothetical protein
VALSGPFGWHIAEAGDIRFARQSARDGRTDEIGREKRERDRHVDLADAFGFKKDRLVAVSAKSDLAIWPST